MTTLSTATAITLVRKNLDEAGLNESVMYTDENNDNLSLDDIIKKNLPEAINAIQKIAPVHLLEGEEYTFKKSGSSEGGSVSVSSDGVLTFTPSAGSNYLRLVAFRAVDSDIVVTDALKEASPEGRKQLNVRIRGRYDRPRLVRQQGAVTPPTFKYYTLKPTTVAGLGSPSNAIAVFSFVKEQFYSESATSYPISRLLRQNIIDWLTGIVMETYANQSAQQTFFGRATSFAE